MSEMWVILSRHNCPHCDNAKVLLKVLGKPYKEFNVEEDRWVLTMMKEANLKTVPQVFNHFGTRIGGYSELKTLLGKENDDQTND